MRFFPWVIILLSFVAALPHAASAETDFERFPFETREGSYRDLAVYVGGHRGDTRLFFPAIRVERPSGDRAILRFGGNRRVSVQFSSAGADDYETGLAMRFADGPVVLHRRNGRIEMEGSVEAFFLRAPGTARPDLGGVAFDGMIASVSWPVDPSPGMQTLDLSLKASAMKVDAALLLPSNMATSGVLATGAVDLRGRVGGRMTGEAVGIAGILDTLDRIEIDRAVVALLGGRVAASGTAIMAPGPDRQPSSIEGTLALSQFSIMIQRLMASRMIAPEHLLPFAMLAGGLGILTPDGTLTLAVKTTEEGVVVINGKPTALRLSK